MLLEITLQKGPASARPAGEADDDGGADMKKQKCGETISRETTLSPATGKEIQVENFTAAAFHVKNNISIFVSERCLVFPDSSLCGGS